MPIGSGYSGIIIATTAAIIASQALISGSLRLSAKASALVCGQDEDKTHPWSVVYRKP